MNRITAIMSAFLVLLLLASGFMAADNIRLSGEHAAIAEELNRQNYDYALLNRQLENQQNALTILTKERDELLLQLQDFQPRIASGEDQTVPASPQPDTAARAAEAPSSLPASAETVSTQEPAATPAPISAAKAPAIPEAAAVTEDIFVSATPCPSASPAFPQPVREEELLPQLFSALSSETDQLKQRIARLETRLEQLLSIAMQQQLPAGSPFPVPTVPVSPDELLPILQESFPAGKLPR